MSGYEVRVASWRLENLKYLGVYEANLFQITHYAPIESFQITQ